MGYCPNCIVRQGSVSWQEVYCDRGLASWGVLRQGQPGHDTALGSALGRGASGTGRARARGRWASWHAQAHGTVPATRRWAGHDTATRAQPVLDGWAKLGHCAPDPILTQFLDSVLFLSQFMDTVHEPGS